MCVGEKAEKGSNSTQHRGTGKSLLKIAEWIAWRLGTDGTAVITGEGVRSYYHKRGYIDDDTFVVKKWYVKRDELLYGMLFVLSIVIVHVIYNMFL